MKFEWKVVIMAIVFSFMCMFTFTYMSSFAQKTIYVYQVGIYKEKSNMENQIQQLQTQGYKPQYYQKGTEYYVLSMISDSQKEIQEHGQKVKGIIKKYIVSYDTNEKQLLDILSRSE